MQSAKHLTHLDLLCVATNVIVRTIASYSIKCGTDPVMALAAWAIELPWLCGRAEADATVTLAPPTADLAIRCPAAAQG